MSRNKTKKLIKFWEQFKGTAIDKGARERIARLQRSHDRHRANSIGNPAKGE